jgi:outer membrane receptor protein involved in Fe transport
MVISPPPASPPLKVGSESSKATTSSEKRSFWDRFRLAQVDQGKTLASGSTEDAARSNSTPLSVEEVVVTAQKRIERLQEVPVPVTALKASTLVEQNQLRLQDYFTSIPGLSVVPGSSSSGSQLISIRGITTGGGTNPTVGFAIDDVPFGSATNLGGGNVADMDPSDLARVEVLRGPQGTLYGASSMGGLIKYVTIDPSFESRSGRLQVGASTIRNGDGGGYNVRGSVNLPVGESLALRASGFSRSDPGYVDNPVLGRDGVNEENAKGGRLSALWRLSEKFSLKLSALYQKFDADGVNDVNDGLGDLQQSYIRGTGESDGSIQAYSATLAGTVGRFDVTSLSGYSVKKARYSADVSGAFGDCCALPAYGYNGTELITDLDTDKFSQEIRVSAPLGRRFDLLIGGFYTKEDSPGSQDILVIDPATGHEVANGYQSPRSGTFSEYALFSNLTMHVTDRFDVQVGGRASRIRQTYQQSTIAPIFGSPTADIGPTTRAGDNPVTYLLTPRFKVSPDLMLYVRMASGYRAGGPNGAFCDSLGFPCEFGSDKTKNYELGAKGDLFGGLFVFDASLYHIDWSDIQLFVTSGGLGFNVNASRARSRGAELSIETSPLTGLEIAAWVSLGNAELTESLPDGSSYGVPGDRLPYSSKVSGSVSIDQTFPLGNATGVLGAALNYVGDRKAAFAAAANAGQPDLPGYARFDLRAAVRYGSWSTNLFVNNVLDKRGLVDVASFPVANRYIQPRSLGVNIAKTF